MSKKIGRYEIQKGMEVMVKSTFYSLDAHLLHPGDVSKFNLYKKYKVYSAEWFYYADRDKKSIMLQLFDPEDPRNGQQYIGYSYLTLPWILLDDLIHPISYKRKDNLILSEIDDRLIASLNNDEVTVHDMSCLED